MEFGLDNSDIKRIKEVFAGFPQVKQVIVFGSRAMGNYKPGSDIDLAIQGDAITFDVVLEIIDCLERLGMLYRFDLQNLSSIKDPAVQEHIKRVGKEFYSA
jgi:predicted nucleotidyltransferase